jgi:DNA-binding winged helix-turn-helix (wHTH) protein
MNISVRDQAIYVFGPFRLDPVRHILLRDGAPVGLPPRLFDTLAYLVAHAGRVVERDELLRAVWGGRVVDESNLKQTIFSLRKALQAGADGDRLIVTAPTRGYLFAAPVRLETVPAGAPPEGAAAVPPVAGRRARLLIGAAALACVAAAFVTWRVWVPRETGALKPPPHSVAVLAFTNLSGDEGQKYLGLA